MIKKLFFYVLLLILTLSCSAQKSSEDIRRKIEWLNLETTYSCDYSKYFANVLIKNTLDYSMKLNLYDIGYKTPPHQSTFDIFKVNDPNVKVYYKGVTVNKDGVDTSSEVLTLEPGKSISFQYDLSKYYQISPLDGTSYVASYEVGATSDIGSKVIHMTSEPQIINKNLCNRKSGRKSRISTL